MAIPDLSEDFHEKSPPPPLMNAVTYQATLENLLGQGQGYGKTESVAAFLLRDLRLVTTTNSDIDETQKDIKVEPLYLVMDMAEWPNEYGRKLAIKDIMFKYAQRVVGEEDLNHPDFRGPGLWTAKKNSFDFDYLPQKDKKSSVHQPNPEAFRVCLTVDHPVTIPTQWGEPFTVESGGTLAIRERDVFALSEALQSIASGKAKPEEALYEEENGQKIARFDVYGMMPDFLEENYRPVALKSETKTATAPFSPPSGPSGLHKSPQL